MARRAYRRFLFAGIDFCDRDHSDWRSHSDSPGPECHRSFQADGGGFFGQGSHSSDPVSSHSTGMSVPDQFHGSDRHVPSARPALCCRSRHMWRVDQHLPAWCGGVPRCSRGFGNAGGVECGHHAGIQAKWKRYVTPVSRGWNPDDPDVWRTAAPSFTGIKLWINYAVERAAQADLL